MLFVRWYPFYEMSLPLLVIDISRINSDRLLVIAFQDGTLLKGQQGVNEDSPYADELRRIHADTQPVDTYGDIGDVSPSFACLPLLETNNLNSKQDPMFMPTY